MAKKNKENSGNYYMEEGIGKSGVAPTSNPAFLNSTGYNPFEISARKVNVGDKFTTDSKYDEYLGDIQEAEDEGLSIGDLRANAQSGWDMAANAIINNLAIAGSTAISGTVGLLDGIFEAATSGELNKLWNNDTTNAMTDFQNEMKEIAPIYRGNQYEDSSIWEKMTNGIFWADLVENFGFTEGMLIPGMGISKLLQGAPKVARMLAPAFISSLGEASQEAINAKNDEIENKKALAINEYNKMAAQTPVEDRPYLEAQLNDTLDNIEKDSINAGNFVFGANVGLLTLTNTIEFGNLFSRGFGTAKRLRGALSRKGNIYSTDPLSWYMTKAAGKKLVDATSEAGEEAAQSIISSTPQNYTDYNTFNESMFNPEKRETVSNLLSAFTQSVAETMNDPNTAVEAMSGFLTGAIGVPMLRRGKVPITIENSIVSEMHDAYKEYQVTSDLADKINTRLADDKKFSTYYNGLVRHLSLQDRMNTALDNSDTKEYKDAESAQFISDAQMFDDAGDINHLRELINNSIDMSDEGIQAIIDETTQEDGEGPFTFNGNKLSVEEARALIQEKKDILNKKLDSYIQSKRELEQSNPDIDEDTLKNAVFLKEQFKDHSDRYDKLSDEVYGGVNKLLQSTPKEKEEESKKSKRLKKGEGVYVKTPEGKRKLVSKDSIDYFDENGYPVFKEENTTEKEKPIGFSSKSAMLLALAYNPGVEGIINEMIDSDVTTMPFDEKQELKSKLADLKKLSIDIRSINKSLKEVLSNPTKSAEDKQKVENKVVENEKAKQKNATVDKVKTSSVSDLVKSAREGEDLDDIFDVLPDDTKEAQDDLDEAKKINEEKSSKSKVKEAKNIVTSTDALIGNAEKVGIISKTKGTDQAKRDAATLLKKSEEIAESEDELLDLTREIFNDPNSLDIEDSELQQLVEQGLSQDEIQQYAQDRLDAAKEVLNDAIGDLDEAKKDLADLQDSPKRKLREVTDSPTTETQPTDTGHDATTKGETMTPSEKAKKQVEEANLTDDMDDALSSLESDNLFENEERIADEDRVVTPSTPVQEVQSSIDKLASSDINKDEDKKENYWKPTTTRLPIHRHRGDNRPFYEIAKELKNNDGSPRYSAAQLQRMEAVYKYLDRVGAFDRVDSNKVKAGDIVKFRIDKALNDEAGDIVILITDNQGNVIGDLMSKQDLGNSSANRGMLAFVEKLEKEYTKADSPQTMNFDYTSHVGKMMIGKAPFTVSSEQHTLNEIATQSTSNGVVTIGEPLLGIAMSDGRNSNILIESGRKRAQGQSAREMATISPLSAKAGEPFLLIETSSERRRYVPIPFIMPMFDASTVSSGLGMQVNKLLQRLTVAPENELLSIKDDIKELLAIDDIFIDLKDNNLRVVIKIGEEKTTIFNGDRINAADTVTKFLYGIPFQISRKYINGQLNGLSYNTLIGEIATTNLPVGGNHTVSDWFTINPIDANSKEIKAKNPKTTGVNPEAVSNTVRVQAGSGKLYDVDVRNWEVLDSERKAHDPKQESEAWNAIRAVAYGLHTSKSLEAPFESPWGWYNPKTGKFTAKPNDNTTIVSTTKAPVKPTESLTGSEETTRNEYKNGSRIQKPSYFSSIVEQLGNKKSSWEYYRDDINRTYSGIEYVTGIPYQSTIEPAIIFAIDSGILSKKYKKYLGKTKEGAIEKEDLQEIIDEFKKLGINSPSELISYVDENSKLNKSITNTNTKSTESQGNRITAEYKKKIEELAGYYEGGGRLITDDFPTVTKELDDKLNNYFWGQYKLTEDDYLELSKHIKFDGVKTIEDKFTNPEATSTVLKEQSILEWVKSPAVTTDIDSYIEQAVNAGITEIKAENIINKMIENESISSLKEALQDVLKFNSTMDYVSSRIAQNLNRPQSTETKATTSEQKATDYESMVAANTEKMKKSRLLGNAKRKALWEVLSPRQKHIIANDLVHQDQWMRLLERAFIPKTNTFSEKLLRGSVDTLLGETSLNRESELLDANSITRAERKWFDKNLPQLNSEDRLRLVHNILVMTKSGNPVTAWGQFSNGVITIAEDAARGTLYHEAFHSVVHTLLTDEEYSDLYDAAKEKYGDYDAVALEEKLAEDFRRYMQVQETPVLGTIARWFQALKRFIKKLAGKNLVIDSLFYRINKGQYANRTTRDVAGVTRNMMTSAQERAKQIFFDKVWGKNLNDNDIVRINRELEFLSRNIDSTVWHLRPSRKGGYYIAGYRNMPVTMDDYWSPGLWSSTRYRLAEVQQYHRDKYAVGNLTNAQQDYLEQRGVTTEEFNTWSTEAKDIFFRCM